MEGERLKVYSEEGLSKMTWRKLEEKRPALSWFKVLHKIRKSASNLANGDHIFIVADNF